MKIRKMLTFVKIILFLAVLIKTTKASNTTIFCSANCASYITACYGPGENDCWACSTSLYLLQKNSSGVC